MVLQGEEVVLLADEGLGVGVDDDGVGGGPVQGLDHLVGDVAGLLLVRRVLQDLPIADRRLGAALQRGVEAGLESLAGLEDENDENDGDDNSAGAEDCNQFSVVHLHSALVSLEGAVGQAAVQVQAGHIPVPEVGRVPAPDHPDGLAPVDGGEDGGLEEAEVAVALPRVAGEVH